MPLSMVTLLRLLVPVPRVSTGAAGAGPAVMTVALLFIAAGLLFFAARLLFGVTL